MRFFVTYPSAAELVCVDVRVDVGLEGWRRKLLMFYLSLILALGLFLITFQMLTKVTEASFS